MRKSLKIGIGVVAGMIALPLVTALVITLFFQAAIKDRFEAAINEQLEAKVYLDGEASFSFFRFFPKASVSFQDVTVMGGPGFETDTLLHAKRVAFLFNPFSLYKGNYEVETVEVAGGFVHLTSNGKGQHNYSIWSTDTLQEDSQNKAVDLELADARLSDMELTYAAATSQQWMHLQVDQLQLGGSWQQEAFHARIRMQGRMEQWREADWVYADSLPLSIDLATDVSLAEKVYVVQPSNVDIAGDTYAIKGRIQEVGNTWDTDISVTGASVRLRSLIALMPPQIRGSLEGWDSEGDLNFTTTVKGTYSDVENPALQVNFDLKEGLIKHPELNKALTDVVLKGSFSNGQAHTAASSTLRIDNLTGKMGPDPIAISLVLDNLDAPIITLTANANLDVDWWAGLLDPLGWHEPTGRIALDNVYLKGALSDWQSGQYPHRTKATGVITVAALAGQWDDQPWAIPVGQLALDQHQLAWQELVMHTGSSDVTTTGVCNNLWTYLTQVAQGDTNAVLEVDATFIGEQLDWADVMAFVPESDGIDLEKAVNYLPYFQQYRGIIDVDFRTFKAAPFAANDVRGRIRWSPYLTRLDGLTLQTAGGQLTGDGFLRVINNQLVLEGQVLGRGVEVDELFLGFDNFWQDFIVADNLKGTVDGNIDCSVAWAPDLSFVEEATSIQAELTVRDGELVDFAPMEDLSDFVKVKELRHIEFSELKNDIRVEGTTVMLPAMQIKSTAMNLWISGTHTFANEIDYQMQIDLLDVIARKVKLGKMKLEQAEQREDGLFNLYVTMTGTVDDFEFATDKATVLARFEESRGMLDPTFLNFNAYTSDTPDKRIQPKDVIDKELDFIDW